jgi:hypothetical protein
VDFTADVPNFAPREHVVHSLEHPEFGSFDINFHRGGRWNLAVVGECVDLYRLYDERSAAKCVQGSDSAAVLATDRTGEDGFVR